MKELLVVEFLVEEAPFVPTEDDHWSTAENSREFFEHVQIVTANDEPFSTLVEFPCADKLRKFLRSVPEEFGGIELDFDYANWISSTMYRNDGLNAFRHLVDGLHKVLETNNMVEISFSWFLAPGPYLRATISIA